MASNPLNRHSTIRKGLGMQKMNPGYSFSLAMQKEGHAIGLVVNAKGGSSIEQWAADTKFYKEAIRRAMEAQKTGTLKGVLWHQGESNHGKPEGYVNKLADLVGRLRKDLGDDNLPFVAGQIISPSLINEAISRLPAIVGNTAFASSEDRLSPDCPPRLGSNASGLSLAMIFVIVSRLSGSMYVTSAIPGSVIIVAGLELTSTLS